MARPTQPLQSRCCRACGAPLTQPFIDLGAQPPANRLLDEDSLRQPETHYPLCAWVCGECLLVQLEDHATPEQLFSDYTYFSSYSASWLKHAEAFVEASMKRLALDARSRVVEVASNDGYLLQYFVERGVPVLGVEPAQNVAQVAEQRGVATLKAFFGEDTARRIVASHGEAQLVVANNVLAHVPDLNDFVIGLSVLVQSGGTVSIEFPHLLTQIRGLQFDTVYHEHYSYFSLLSLGQALERQGMQVVDVERLATHGGSLRVYAQALGHGQASDAVASVLAHERAAGLDQLTTYAAFGPSTAAVRRSLLRFLIDCRDQGKRVAGYGAAAKGTTFLNSCGVGPELLDYVVDASPHKQHRYLPGARIPVLPPHTVMEKKPDYLLILPWNLRQEIMDVMACVRDWGGRFVTAVPQLEVHE